MAAVDLPLLIVGDVHGDLERLFAALKPYQPEKWRTIFLGDLVDYGMFGVGAMRYARDRANSEVLLGNHEVAMHWALRDSTRVGFWVGIGGQLHDLDELRKDDELQRWVRERPAMTTANGALIQHCGNDVYLEMGSSLESINQRAREMLTNGRERELWNLLSSPNVFEAQPARLERYLELMHAQRVVFGHKPHRGSKPMAYHGGKAINFDGGLSRSHRLYQHGASVSASVGPLDP